MLGLPQVVVFEGRRCGTSLSTSGKTFGRSSEVGGAWDVLAWSLFFEKWSGPPCQHGTGQGAYNCPRVAYPCYTVAQGVESCARLQSTHDASSLDLGALRAQLSRLPEHLSLRLEGDTTLFGRMLRIENHRRPLHSRQ